MERHSSASTKRRQLVCKGRSTSDGLFPKPGSTVSDVHDHIREAVSVHNKPIASSSCTANNRRRAFAAKGRATTEGLLDYTPPWAVIECRASEEPIRESGELKKEPAELLKETGEPIQKSKAGSSTASSVETAVSVS